MGYSLILSLLLSAFSEAAYISGMKPGDVMIAGKLLSGQNLIILNMQNQGGTGTISTGYKINPVTGGAPAAYVVPASREFIIHAVSCDQINANSTSTLPQRLVYADNSGIDVSPTNVVGAISGVSGTNLNDTIYGPHVSGGEPTKKEVALFGRVPTGKYPGIYNNTGSFLSVCRIYGYEITP